MSAALRVALVPSTLLLVPEYAGRFDPIPDLRARAHAAVAWSVESAGRIVVVTATDRDPRHSKAPAGERVARALLRDRAPDEVVAVEWDASPQRCRDLGARLHAEAVARHTAVVVVGDGCARRTEKAPGHLDERCFSYDEAWLRAVASGALDGLRTLEPGLGADLLCHGRAPFQVLAGAAETAVCEEVWSADPFGVLYAVARLRVDGER